MNENEEFEFRLRMEREAQAAPPSTARVALQSAAKGAASVPDLFLGAPAQAFNLGSAGIGYAAGELGRPDITAKMPIAGPALTQPVLSGLEAVGAVRPEFEPRTAGERILGRGLETAPSFMLSPGKTGTKLATGLLSGMTGQTAEETALQFGVSPRVAKGIGIAVSMVTPTATNKIVSGGKSKLEPVAGATLKEARQAGYVVPPSIVKPTTGTNVMERVAGKASVSQEASVRNQQVTNNLAAKAIGLPEGTPLTKDTLQTVRDKAGQVYHKIDELAPTVEMDWFPRFHERNLGEQLKQARADATAWFKSYAAKPMPSFLKKAQQYESLADSLESDIERIAKASGQPNLLNELKEARTLFAKTYDIERALIPGTGNVSASAIGNLLKTAKGKKVTGELEVIGKFAKAFPREARESVSVPSPGISGTDALSSAILGMEGYGMAGRKGILAAGLPYLRVPARGAVLSGPIQNRLVAQPKPLGDVALQGLLAGRAGANQ